MVSDDLPDPETPVTTVNLFRGIVTVTFFKLCTLAPEMNISLDVVGTFVCVVLFFLIAAIVRK
jgi:hypothetical protein